MSQILDDQEQRQRLDAFMARLGTHLPDKRQRASFAAYSVGLLSELERKSVEPIAALLCPTPDACKHMQNRLLDFLRVGRWEDRPVRLEAARYAIEAVSAHEPVNVWIIDDTGFIKKGRDSVGVQRQYTGSAGKITNCQLGVSLCIASRSVQFPIDFELYIPEDWLADQDRRDKVRIPKDLTFKSKIDIALDMIDRATQDGIPGDVLLADAAYGMSLVFRDSVRLLGFDYGVAVKARTSVWLVDDHNNVVGDQSTTVQALGIALGRKAFRKYTWREGTKGKMSGKFCFRRVKVAQDDGSPLTERETLWLMIEWPDGEQKPTKFVLTTMPHRMSKKKIICIVKERWKTERMYEELKGEVGLDHFEGRSFPGWHHHVSVVICSYAFMVSERVGAFSPLTTGQDPTGANASAASTALSGFADKHPPHDCSCFRAVAAKMSRMSALESRAPISLSSCV
jgi:SRSO17 transposase